MHAGEAWLDPELERLGGCHLARVVSAGAKLTDGPVVAMQRSGPGGVDAVRSSYAQMIRSCDALRAEYLAAAGRDRRELALLPLRRRAHAVAGADPVRSGDGRAAAIGFSVVLVNRRGPIRELLIGERRRDLATDPGIWHVAPSGTLEPIGDDVVRETMRVEVPEELPAVAAVSQAAVAALIDRTRALGIGYDLLRLKPDLCMVAEVGEDDSWFGDGALSPDEFVGARRVTLTPRGLADFWEAHGPEALTPAAAAAIALVEERYLPEVSCAGSPR
jgi:hypothetical protein